MIHSRVLKGSTKGLEGMYNNPKATYAIFQWKIQNTEALQVDKESPIFRNHAVFLAPRETIHGQNPFFLVNKSH